VRVWVPFLLVLALGVWLCESLASGVQAASFAVIDPSMARLCDPRELPEGGGFVDERWEQALRRELASAGSFLACDPEGTAELVRRVAGLPFVAAVGEPHVVWPDGLELALRLRVPVACVRSGECYFAISQDGVLLPGAWPAPPWIGAGYLPVIGPNDGSFDALPPGTHSPSRPPRRAAVALSMRVGAGARRLRDARAVLIDATRARQASATEPGVELRLVERRVIVFGRAPDSGEPGELPVPPSGAR
jgi:hypothetical protein